MSKPSRRLWRNAVVTVLLLTLILLLTVAIPMFVGSAMKLLLDLFEALF